MQKHANIAVDDQLIVAPIFLAFSLLLSDRRLWIFTQRPEYAASTVSISAVVAKTRSPASSNSSFDEYHFAIIMVINIP